MEQVTPAGATMVSVSASRAELPIEPACPVFAGMGRLAVKGRATFAWDEA